MRFTTPIAILVLTGVCLAGETVFSVSSGASATHATIQAAVNDCPSVDSCIIRLLDPAYNLDRPIWIEGKSKLAIVGKTPDGNAPVLRYDPSLLTMVANPATATNLAPKVRKLFTLPFLLGKDGLPCDAEAADCVQDPERPAGWLMWPVRAASMTWVPNSVVGDKDDVSNPYSRIGHQFNGMVMVRHSTDIVLRGIQLSGGLPGYFVNDNIWSQMYDILFGSVGVNIQKSLRVTVQDCEIQSFFAGVFVHGDSVNGDYRAPYRQGTDAGDHLFERNRIHDNWWAFYSQSDFDLGSTIRYNLVWDNMNKAIQFPDSLKDANIENALVKECTGGFHNQTDSAMSTYRIHNNTLLGHGIVFGYLGWGEREIRHVFFNNLLVGPVWKVGSNPTGLDFSSDFRQMLSYSGKTVYNNTFELEGAVTISVRTMTQADIVSDTLPDPLGSGARTCALGCWVNIEPVALPQLPMQPFLWNGWGIQRGTTYDAFFTDKQGKRWGPFETRDLQGIDSTGLIVTMAGVLKDSLVWKAHLNKYGIRIPMESRDPGAEGFLVPRWDTRTVQAAIRHGGWAEGPRNADTSLVDRGAYCLDESTGESRLGGCNGRTAGISRGEPTGLMFRAPGVRSDLGARDPLGRIRRESSWLFRDRNLSVGN